MSLEKDLNRYIQKTINKTINKIKNEQAKLIKEELGLDTKKIKSMTRIKKATPNNLQASILSLNTHVSLKNFKKSNIMQGKKIIGVNVQISKKQRVALKGHFMATSKNNKGDFIAIRENSKQGKNPSFIYKVSKSTYPTGKLLYPLSLKSFSEIALSKSGALQRKAKEIFVKES